MTITAHPVAPEEIMALLDRELSAAQAESVSAHVAVCSECQSFANSLSQTSQRVATWTVSAASKNPLFENRLVESARNASSRERSITSIRPGAFLRRHWILTAASSAVVVGALFMVTGRSLRAPHNFPVDLARTDNARGMDNIGVDGQPITDQQTTIFSNQTPEASRKGTLGKLAALSPGVAADRNGALGATIGGLRGAEQLQLTPMIARTVSLFISTKDFNASRASLDAILARHHGYAASLSANTEQNAARSLQASLRIPAAELNAAVSELKLLGRVENEAQNGEEVTQQHADLVARLKNSRETEQRLQAILQQRTGKIKDVLAVEQEVARVRGQIEQMEAEQKSLEHRVDFATIDLKLTEEYKAQLNPPSPSISTRFHNAFVAGYRDAVETIVSILLFFAEYGPSLLIWLALLFPAGWLLWRRWRRSYALASNLAQ